MAYFLTFLVVFVLSLFVLVDGFGNSITGFTVSIFLFLRNSFSEDNAKMIVYQKGLNCYVLYGCYNTSCKIQTLKTCCTHKQTAHMDAMPRDIIRDNNMNTNMTSCISCPMAF